MAGAILDHHAEAAGIADAGNRWWRRNENQAVMNRRKALEKLSLNRGSRLPRILRSLLEWIQRHENRARIGCVGESGAGETDDIHGMRDSGHGKRNFDGLAVNLVSAGQRSGRRKLCNDDEIAAVELRNEADRRLAELVQAERYDAGIDQQHQHGDTYELRRELSITARKHIEVVVEHTEERVERLAPPMSVLDLAVRLEQHRAQRRRQR